MNAPASHAGMGEAGRRRKWLDAHLRDKGTLNRGNTAEVRDAPSGGLLRASYPETSRLCVKPVGLGFVLNREVINPPAFTLMSQSYNSRRFWDRVAQIRNEMDSSRAFHEAQAVAIETAVNEVVSNACWPWFDPQSLISGEPK